MITKSLVDPGITGRPHSEAPASEVMRNIEAELVVSQISPPSITFLQFYLLREISVDNHQATKQGIYNWPVIFSRLL